MPMTEATARQHFAVLLDQYGDHMTDGWTLTFDRAKRRAGWCNGHNRVIGLSTYLMSQRTAEETILTLIHEFAHAIVGVGHAHDRVWQQQCLRMGGNGQAFHSHVDTQAKYQAKCGHGSKFARHRRPASMTGWRCKCARPVGMSFTDHKIAQEIVWRQMY